MTEFQNISNLIFNIKEKLTDNEFKTIMENLIALKKNTVCVEEELMTQLYKQHFYHLPQNKNCFYFKYMNEDNTLIITFEYNMIRMKEGDTFLYEKVLNYIDETIDENFATIIKIKPKYSVVEINNYHKKISNKTLSKIWSFPYINFI